MSCQLLSNDVMSAVIKWKFRWLLLVSISISLLVFYYLCQLGFIGKPSHVETPHKKSSFYPVWPAFNPQSPIDHSYFRQKCAKNHNLSITGLADITLEWSKSPDTLCRTYYDKFSSVFTLTARKATINKIPEPFQRKIRGWLGNSETLYHEVHNQDVVHVVNEYTREHTIFNTLRDKRPLTPPDESEAEYVAELLKKTAESCDFCRFKEYTAEHDFGRVETAHSFSASNVFKLDSLHAVLVMKNHNPLNWSYTEYMDLFQLTNTWLQKAHTHNPEARHPALSWDILPKCGASQVHPHLQVVLDTDRYHGTAEAWRRGSQDYFLSHDANYFSDLVAVHTALNLTVTFGDAVAFASLVPKKDHEVVVMSAEPGPDFFTLLYFVLRAFIDDLHKMCFSMGMAMPAFNTEEGKLPAFARAVTRGYVTDLRTDMSALEMFLASNVNIDPYKTIEIVRSSVNQRKHTIS